MFKKAQKILDSKRSIKKAEEQKNSIHKYLDVCLLIKLFVHIRES